VSGIFTDPKFGPLIGALALTEINLKGSTELPVSAIVVNFRSFSADPSNPLQSVVTICDAALQQGQGMHGNFSRADTLNNMAGPILRRDPLMMPR
jgi:hypothetical protein